MNIAVIGKIKSPLTTIIWSTIFVLAGTVVQAQELPLEAQGLYDKLKVWEDEKTQELNSEIAEKRSQVSAALETHLESATKSGNLDGALAIRKLIAELANSGEQPAQSAELVNPDAISIEEHLLGTTWSWRIQSQTLSFSSQGKAVVTMGGSGSKISMLWEHEEDRDVSISRDGGGKEMKGIIQFSRNFSEGVLVMSVPEETEIPIRLLADKTENKAK